MLCCSSSRGSVVDLQCVIVVCPDHPHLRLEWTTVEGKIVDIRIQCAKIVVL